MLAYIKNQKKGEWHTCPLWQTKSQHLTNHGIHLEVFCGLAVSLNCTAVVNLCYCFEQNYYWQFKL